VIETIRHAEVSPLVANEGRPELIMVSEMMQRVDGAISAALAQQTVKNLVLAQAAPNVS
jgi:hypothetical protein